MQGEHQATFGGEGGGRGGGGGGRHYFGSLSNAELFKVTRGILQKNVYLLCSFSHLTQAHRG